MKRKWLIFFVCLLFVTVQAENFLSVVPHTFSAGGASVADNFRWTAFHNPSQLSSKYVRKGRCVNLYYHNAYGMKELSTASVSLAFPTRWVDFGVAVSWFGFSAYNETLFGLTVSKKIYQFIAALQLNYFAVGLAGEGEMRGKFVPQIGFTVEPIEEFILSAQAFNPFVQNLQFSFGEKKLPTVVSIGASYFLMGRLRFLLSAEENFTGEDFVFRAGLEYFFEKYFRLSLGVSTEEELVPQIGFGVTINRFLLDAQLARRYTLGFDFGVALGYQF